MTIPIGLVVVFGYRSVPHFGSRKKWFDYDSSKVRRRLGALRVRCLVVRKAASAMHPCEFGIPTVYQPSEAIRTLRRLIADYTLLNRQIRMLKNTIQAMLAEDGVVLCSTVRSRLFKGKEAASGILADVGDVHRFPSLRRTNTYLGLVPRCHDSGGKSRPGHITRESRKLSQTILTQSIYQTIKATPGWERDYEEL